MTLVRPEDVRYRGNSGGSSNILAKPGIDYNMYEEGTRIQWLKSGWYADTIKPVQQSDFLGRKFYYRVKFTSYSYILCAPWAGFQIFRFNPSNGSWYDFKIEYGATASSTHKWYINNSLKYSGTGFAYPEFFYQTTTSATHMYDVGDRGAVCPSGYEFLPKSVL